MQNNIFKSQNIGFYINIICFLILFASLKTTEIENSVEQACIFWEEEPLWQWFIENTDQLYGLKEKISNEPELINNRDLRNIVDFIEFISIKENLLFLTREFNEICWIAHDNHQLKALPKALSLFCNPMGQIIFGLNFLLRYLDAKVPNTRLWHDQTLYQVLRQACKCNLLNLKKMIQDGLFNIKHCHFDLNLCFTNIEIQYLLTKEQNWPHKKPFRCSIQTQSFKYQIYLFVFLIKTLGFLLI